VSDAIAAIIARGFEAGAAAARSAPVVCTSRLPSLVGMLLALLCLGIPPAALADDIYRWTDGQGRTVISNVPPRQSENAKNLNVMVKAAKPAAAAAPAPAAPAAAAAVSAPPAGQAAASAPAEEEEAVNRRPRRRRSVEPE